MFSPRPLHLAVLAGTVLTCASASAGILNWASAVSGTASTAANWNPVQIPLAGDDLVFDASAGAQSYTVTFGPTTSTSRLMTFKEDAVTLSMTSAHTTTSGVNIGLAIGDNPTVTLATGTWNSTANNVGAFDIAEVSGSTGVVNVNDDDAVLNVPGVNARMRIGFGGDGTLNITNGGQVEVGDSVLVGNNVTSSGVLTVSGAQSSIIPFWRSTLRTLGAAGQSHYGDTGDATVTISNGALVEHLGTLFIAKASGSTNVTVGGAGGIFQATLDVADDIFVGSNELVGNDAGGGTLTINDDGHVMTDSTLHIGDDPDGGLPSQVNLNTGGFLTARSVVRGALGTLNHTGGTLKINGGTYAGFTAPLVVTGASANDVTLTFANSSNQTLTPVGGTSAIVGDDIGGGTFEGFLRVEGGADLNMGSGDLIIGDESTATGHVTVTGTGSTLTANQANCDIRVGLNGVGNLAINAGGATNFRNLLIPSLTGSNGSGNGDVDAGVLTTQNLVVGLSSGAGTGTLDIMNGSTLNVTSTGAATSIRNTGTMLIDGTSVFNATGDVLIDGGRLNLGGTVNVGLMDIDAGNLIAQANAGGTPTVNGDVTVRSGAVVQAILDDLTIGDATSLSGVSILGGTINIGSGRTLTLRDSSTAIMQGFMDLAGGTVLVDGSHMTIQGGSTLQGFGILQGSVLQLVTATCTASGSGLVFANELRMNPGAITTGTAVRMSTGSTLEPPATSPDAVISAAFTLDSSATIRPVDNDLTDPLLLTIGNGAANGATLNGIINMGTGGRLTINDSNGCALPVLTTMDAGLLISNNGLVLNSGRTLRGNGSVSVPSGVLNVTAGNVDPDDYFPATNSFEGIGEIGVNGNFTMGSAADYFCDIAGFDNEFRPLNDVIDVGLHATLSGTVNLSLYNGYVPQLCDEFKIVRYTTRTGTFTSLVTPPGVDAGLRYESDGVVLFFNSVECDSIDFNRDEVFPDSQDLVDLFSVFGAGSCSTGNCADLDFNNDCVFPDSQDLVSYISVFGAGPCL